jgi:hypothetical protein
MHVATIGSRIARTAIPLLLLGALAACGEGGTPVAPPSAAGARTTPAATAELLVSGLEGAFGSTLGPGGALYVAESAAGRIARIDPRTGAVTTFASGLPVNLGTGVQDIAFVGQTAYALVSFVTPEAFGGTGVDGIYRIDGPDSFTIIADIGAFNRANPPETEFFISTGVLVAIEAYRGGFLVTDGHLNRVLYVTRDGEISVFRAFDNIVPTGLDVQGETVYMAEAGPLPHLPEDGKVVAFGARSTSVVDVASGAPLLVDLKLGRGRTLFALSQGTWDGVEAGEPALPNTGALVRADGSGAFTTIMGGLDRPVSMELDGTTAWVVTLDGEVWTISNVAGPPFGGSR